MAGRVTRFGNTRFVYNDEGVLHSYDDEPAVIYWNTKSWYKNGFRHRDDDKPAVINSDGSKAWWVNGERHRDNDKPAIIYFDGTKEWWVNGHRHRDDDKPAIIGAKKIYPGGTKKWFHRGKECFFICKYKLKNGKYLSRKYVFEVDANTRMSQELSRGRCAWVEKLS